MVKPKPRQLGAIPANKSNTEVDLLGEDGWVIVKKQRVTILVPPHPVAKKSTAQNLGPVELQAEPRKSVDNRPQFPIETLSRMPAVDEQEKSMSLVPKRGIQIARKAPSAQHISTLAKPQKLDLWMGPENPEQVGLKTHNVLGASNSSKGIRQLRLSHGPGSILDQGALLNKRLRAFNLERKLQKAGGLSRWLASLGLGQFVRFFHGRSINKFQLVNLTMKKLKDMGADAVGPRRKLMHAIECICQPYCFETI